MVGWVSECAVYVLRDELGDIWTSGWVWGWVGGRSLLAVLGWARVRSWFVYDCSGNGTDVRSTHIWIFLVLWEVHWSWS